MNWRQILPRQDSGEETLPLAKPQQLIVEQCYCPNGHSILSPEHQYSGYPGLLLKLKTDEHQGLLSISPIIGDHARDFYDFVQTRGEVVEICCPVCDKLFPIYNACNCKAHLIALFTSPKIDYADCIGICQRIGCLYSEIISGRDLHLLNRVDYF